MIDLDAIRHRFLHQMMACGPDGEMFAKVDGLALIAEVERLRGTLQAIGSALPARTDEVGPATVARIRWLASHATQPR